MIAASGLQLLHKIAGSAVKDAVPGFDQGMADGAQNIRFAGAGIADGDEVVAAVQPVTGSGGFDPGE